MKIFSGSSNGPLAEKIAEGLRLTLSPLEIHIFPDGEKRVRVVDEVVDENCIVVQSTPPNVNENYIELFFIVDALKRSGAKSVTAVIPYLGYQRQDHVFREGEAVSIEVMVKTLQASGADKIITFDLHSIKIPQFFSIPIAHLSALPLFAEKIRAISEGGALSGASPILISPDMGGIRRIKLLSELLGDMPYASIEKDRNLKTGAIRIKNIHVAPNIQLKGRFAFIVDDMIASGGTIDKAVNFLKKKGIAKIWIFATHAVFAENAKIILKKIKAEKIYVTNSVFVPKEKQFPKLQILSIARIIIENL